MNNQNALSPAARRAAANGPARDIQIARHVAFDAGLRSDSNGTYVVVGYIGLPGFRTEFRDGLAAAFIRNHNASRMALIASDIDAQEDYERQFGDDYYAQRAVAA